MRAQHAVAGWVLLVAACGSPQASAPPDREAHYLEVYSWLVAGPEAQAMNALYDMLRQRDPAIELLSPEFEVPGGRLEIEPRFAAHSPPDALQVIQGDDIGKWIGMDVLAPLDATSAAEGWPSVFPKAVLDSVGANGSLYGVPLDIERDNTLFFNKWILAAHGLSPPRSIAGALDVAVALSATGQQTFTMSGAGWMVASTFFESVLVAEAGPDFYQAYLTGQLAPDAPEVRAALVDLAKLVDFANADVAATGWGDAVDRFCNGEGAVLLMPDFAKGELVSTGCLDSTRIGYMPVEPAGAPTFVFLGLGFALAKEAKHAANGMEFLQTVGSRDGQEAFNRLKLALPARTDTDVSQFDFVSVAEATDYRAAGEHLVLGYEGITPRAFQDNINLALGRFVDSSSTDYQNVDTALAALRSNYALLQP
jgi:glucose/mannose transport system substrate-binding protein